MRSSVRHAAQVITQFLWVRFHMALILVAVFASGLVASRVLFHLGIRSMPMRYAAAVLIGYLLFFVGVRIWIGYARERLPSRFGDKVASIEEQDAAGSERDNLDPAHSRRGFDFDLPDPGLDGDGCLVAIVVLALLGACAYAVVEAPAILGEAMVQAVLTAALRRRTRAIEAAHWSGSVLRATWGLALIILFIAVVTGLLAQHRCASATNLLEAWRCP